MLVCGTGTEVGKTWVASRLLEELRSRGVTVAARKPAQSFDADAAGVCLRGPTDADVLGAASGEPSVVVCPQSHSYRRAMAPPMAAEALGLPSFTIDDLIAELAWPDHRVNVGLVEMAGGVRSPQALDGDVTDFMMRLRPDLVVLVSDAGLGTINSVRMSLSALRSSWDPPLPDGPGRLPEKRVVPIVTVLDRFDVRHDLHRRNLEWLVARDGFVVLAIPGQVPELADLASGSPAASAGLSSASTTHSCSVGPDRRTLPPHG